MARTLGGVALPDGTGPLGKIRWVDRHQRDPVAQSAERTLGGNPVVFAQALQAARPITLVAATELGAWLDAATVAALEALAAEAGASYLLVWDAETYTVVFRHHEPPAASFEPVHVDESWDRYVGEIRLMTV